MLDIRNDAKHVFRINGSASPRSEGILRNAVAHKRGAAERTPQQSLEIINLSPEVCQMSVLKTEWGARMAYKGSGEHAWVLLSSGFFA